MKKLVTVIVCILCVSVLLTGTSALADDTVVRAGWYVGGTADFFVSLFDTIGVRGSSMKYTGFKAGYSAMEEALRENGNTGAVNIAFPIYADPQSTDEAFICTDLSLQMDVTLVFKGTYTDKVPGSIAVRKGTYLTPYAYALSGGKAASEYDSEEDALKALYDGKVKGVLIPTCLMDTLVYANSNYRQYFNAVRPELPCVLCVAVKDAELAGKINTAVADKTVRIRAEGLMRSFLEKDRRESSSVGFIGSNLSLLVLLPVIAVLIILSAIIYRKYKADHREQGVVINGLSRDFECVTLLDAASSHENRVRVSPFFSSRVEGWAENTDYERRMRRFAETLVVEDDRARFTKETEKVKVTEALRDESAYTVNFRMKTDNGVKYFQVKYVHDEKSKNSIVMGIHNVDGEVRRELELQKKIQENETTRRLSLQIVTVLVKILDAKDKYTNGHSERVARYSMEIAARCGMSEEKQREIYYMGLLHDIGKIGIPDDVIDKTGSLTDEEYAIIKQHPVLGAEILESITEMPKVKTGALSHHERFDGKGYPEGLRGDQISKEARILAVADAYDAMSSPRSFRDALPQQRIRAEIEKGSGTQFDPAFASVMLKMIDDDTEFKMRDMSWSS